MRFKRNMCGLICVMVLICACLLCKDKAQVMEFTAGAQPSVQWSSNADFPGYACVQMYGSANPFLRRNLNGHAPDQPHALREAYVYAMGLADFVSAHPMETISIILVFCGLLGLLIYFFVLDVMVQREKIVLEHTNKAKTEFLAHISHEIRTPLGAIIGMNRIAAENIDQPDIVLDCTQKIELSAVHLLGIINDVLDFTKSNEGKLRLNVAPFDLISMMALLADVYGQAASDAQLQLITHVDAEIETCVLGDELRLKQVLINLISNAIKYNCKGGSVTVTAKRVSPAHGNCGQTICFCVKDTGIGMEEAFASHIFDGYMREGRSHVEGTGLGLNISKRIVEQMNGELKLKSELGVGSAFFFTVVLPACSAVPACATKARQPTINLQGRKILVAEDNAINMQIVETMLARIGADVVKAENGKEAVRCFSDSHENEYFAILVDICMPIMDGYEATKCIRTMHRADAMTVPILALSANAFDEDVQMSLSVGMNAHLSKPLDASILYDELYKLLKKAA